MSAMEDAMRTHRLCLSLTLGCAACSSAGASPSASEPVAREQSPITTQQWWGVAEIVSYEYGDPDYARASYAEAELDGCSATAIGPNVVMSAAHCGTIDNPAIFRVYDQQDYRQELGETFSCHNLISTAPDSDLALYACDPNQQGQSPGDKYGYLDFDRTAPVVGQSVYSVWSNPVDNLGTQWQTLYSQGTVTSTNQAFQFSFGSQPVGIVTNVWSHSGASGSVQIDQASQRILVGPTSLGYQDAAGRIANSMQGYLTLGRVTTVDGLNGGYLASRGLNSGRYLGGVDKNGDGVFDVQADLEQTTGENTRDWYWLGFESERRNALWTRATSTSIDPTSGWAHYTGPSSYAPVLTHSRLNLVANQEYKVKLSFYNNGAPGWLYVSLVKNGVTEASTFFPAPTDGATHTIVAPVQSPVDGTSVVVSSSNTSDVYFRDVSVVLSRATADFDINDKRETWRNGNRGGRALTLPEPNGLGTANWAAKVVRDTGFPRGSDFAVSTSQLPFVAGRSYKLCFNYAGIAPVPSNTNWGLMRVVNGAGTELVHLSFSPFVANGASTQTCTPSFVGAPDLSVQFGVDADPITSWTGSTTLPAYLVDTIVVVE
jgi:hypothetical protein